MRQRWFIPLLVLLCGLPLIRLLTLLIADALGPDPGEAIMQATGEWSLRMLLLTLLVSPLRHWSGFAALLPARRVLGLWTFVYAGIHLLVFSHFYVGWSLDILTEELLERPYIVAGFTAWLVLLPLAMTSTRAMQRRLRRNWRRLHRLVYVATLLACVHLLWQVRSDFGATLFYSLVAAALLGWRIKWLLVRRRALAS